MKFSGLFGTLATAIFLPATQATWCQFFYDASCTNDANPGVNFDCANHDFIGSGGGFVKCHYTTANHQSCLVHRYNDATHSSGTDKNVESDSSCIDMLGAGPYYQLYLVE